jgi:hypothetical protein
MSISKRSAAITLVVAAMALAACKGETKEVDRPETLKSLEECQDRLKDKDELIADLNTRLGEAELAGGGAVLVKVEGDVLSISGAGGPNQRKGGGPSVKVDDEKLYKAFLSAIRLSRGAMQRCYQNALKKHPDLQAGKTTVTIRVDFAPSGKAAGASINPRVDADFAACMSGVAKTLTIPEAPISVTFEAPVELTPE